MVYYCWMAVRFWDLFGAGRRSCWRFYLFMHLFMEPMEWDRLLWDAGLGRSNRKNNHFWDIRTIACFHFPFPERRLSYGDFA